MKNLLKNLWEAPASTLAAGIIASLGIVTTQTELDLPGWVILAASALAAFLAAFDGPNGTK